MPIYILKRMEIDDHCEFSPNYSLNSSRVLCLTVFWIIAAVLIIMAGVTVLLVALGMLGMTGVTIKTVEAAHVKLSVYYETLCPDSRRFIINQLYPTIQTLGGVSNEYLETEFVPYGKATTEFVNGTFQFDCQHGDQECEGNKVHACALQKLAPSDAAAFINCSMAVFDSPITDPQCAASLGLNYTRIQNCLDSWEANALLAVNGIETHDLQPSVYYVPWIMFNNQFTTEDLSLAQRNLLGLLCDKLGNSNNNITLPAECSSKTH